jgi:hypothetical protein
MGLLTPGGQIDHAMSIVVLCDRRKTIVVLNAAAARRCPHHTHLHTARTFT